MVKTGCFVGYSLPNKILLFAISFFLLLNLSSCSSDIFTITLTVRGIIADTTNDSPIENADVALRRLVYGEGRIIYAYARTNSEGYYTLEYSGERQNFWTLNANAEGFKDWNEMVYPTEEVQIIDFKLQPQD